MVVGVSTPPVVPLTPIYRRYRDVIALHDEPRRDLARDLAKDPTPLAVDFAASVAQMTTSYVNAAPFRPTARLPRPPTRPGIANGTDLAWHLHEQGTLTVADAPELAAEYADYELSVLSTRGRAVFDDEAQTPAGRALKVDVLLANAADRTPIVAEVKFRRDKEPFSAIVQLLAYIAHLTSPSQYERLRTHVPTGDYPAAEVARFDGYLMLYRFGESANTYLDDLLHAAEATSEGLMRQAAVTRHVRRLVCLDLSLDEDAALSATVRWRHDAP